MANERRAFGSICPNRMGNCASRSRDKKPGKYDDDNNNSKWPRSVRNRSSVAVFCEETPRNPGQALATLAWREAAGCARRQDSGYDIQGFVDSAVTFMSEPPTLGETSLTPDSLLLSDFEECIVPPIPPLRDCTLENCLPNHPARLPLPHHEFQPQFQHQAEPFWRDLAAQHHEVLGTALTTNSQLHLTLNKKEEEIASLQERNVHLKELANHAKHLATILDKLMMAGEESHTKSVPSAASFLPVCGTKRRRLEELCEQPHDCEDVDDILRNITERCNAVLRREANLFPSHRKEVETSSPQRVENINMYGSFRGMQTSMTLSGVSAEGGVVDEESSFRTSVRDHCTIRTLTFPQGHAFTSTTPSGGYRFRWVPS